MIVKELIEELKRFNPESTVLLTVSSGVTENVFEVQNDPESSTGILICGWGIPDDCPKWHDQHWCDHCGKAAICQVDSEGCAICFECKNELEETGGAMIQGIETFAGFLVILMAVLPLAWIFYAVLAHLVVPAIRDLGRPEAGPGDAEGGRWLE